MDNLTKLGRDQSPAAAGGLANPNLHQMILPENRIIARYRSRKKIDLHHEISLETRGIFLVDLKVLWCIMWKVVLYNRVFCLNGRKDPSSY